MKTLSWLGLSLGLSVFACQAQLGLTNIVVGGGDRTNRYTSLNPLGAFQAFEATQTNTPIIIQTNGSVFGLNPITTTGSIVIQSNGAVAQFAPHKAFFAPNPNTMEAVQLNIPDRGGQLQLKSHLVGLGFWDITTGDTVLFASPQDCIGEISGSIVRYTNALNGTDAEITYTYAWDNFDQTIVLRKKIPEPAALSMTNDPANLRLVVITEFIDPPEPLRVLGTIDLTAKNQAFGIQSENTIPDETLYFGSMRMAGGKMLLLGNSNIEVPSGKTLMTVDGSHYLVEFCPWLLMKALVDSLPSGTLHAKVKARGDLKSAIAQIPKPGPDKSNRRMVQVKPRSQDLALNGSTDSQPGVVLDYLLVSRHLLDIDLGGNNPEKAGFAAVGQYTNDFWISYFYNYSSLTNLTWSDQSSPNSGVGITVSGISGAWGNGVNDQMYGGYIYGLSGGSLTLTLTNLPTNVFNFYIYGHEARDVANASFKLLRGGTQIAYKGTTLWGNAWKSTNWEPGLQYQVFKNIAVTNQTIQFQIPSGGDTYPYANGLQVVESAAVPPPPTNITNLFNVNFGSPSTNKAGLAAVGLTTNDYWNGYTSTNFSSSIVGLTNASGIASTVGLSVFNVSAIGSWNGGGNGDAMYTSFIYATNEGNVTVLLTNLSTGNYDFYLYGHGNTNDANTIFQLWSGGRDWDVRGTTIWGSGYSNSTAWDESQQYVVYHDIPVDSNQVVTIVAGHDPYGSANLNGMQIVYKGSYDTNSDGLPDVWKTYYFGSTSATATGDPDNDKLSNLREFQVTTDPTKNDTDGNGLSDGDDSERVWVEDVTPARGIENDSAAASPFWSGAYAENWNWTDYWIDGWGGNGVGSYSWNPYSSCYCMHVSDTYSGIHQHWFDKSVVNMMVNTGEVLITYVNIDPDNPPTEIMLQWYTTEANGLDSWEHRAYWGSDAISWGVEGTESCWYVANLPAAGAWTRLEVPASAVGLEGKVIQGMAFTLYNGRAAFDHAGKLIPDMDGNGLDDSWEKYYFSSIGQDPYGDPDHDGLSNLQEFLAGTNPTNCSPPEIWDQPQGACAYPGGTTYFVVTPTGSVLTNYHFQWRLGGTNIASATNNTLVLTNVQSMNLGDYSVVLTNGCGSVTSSVATLTFCPSPFVQITAPQEYSAFAEGSGFTAPAQITIQATATNSDSSVTNVEFYRGNLFLLGHATAAPYSYTWTAAAGLYSITAVAYDSHGLVSTSSPVSITVGSACGYSDSSYSSNNAFGGGFLMNLNYANSFGRLQLNSQTTPFPFVNVASSDEGTVVRLDSATGQVIGEYRTAPQGKASFPSNVQVDRYGNAWVDNWDEGGNRDQTHLGSITRIGVVIGGTRGDIQKNEFGQVTNFTANSSGHYLQPPFLYSTAIDRDGDGYIKTSAGLNDVLDWPTNTVGGSTGTVFNADDELIINYVRVPAQLASALAIDTNNDLWVGGYCDDNSSDYGPGSVCGTKIHVKVDGVTGQVLTNSMLVFTNGGVLYGGFEGLVSGNGMLWFSGGANPGNAGDYSLVTYNPATGITNITPNSKGDFDIAIDPATGNVWVSSYQSNRVAVYSQSGSFITNYYHGDTYASGLVIDNNSNVWVAHGPWNGTGSKVGHLLTDGTFIGNVDLNTTNCPNPARPSIVAVDNYGKVWALSAADSHILRIDPNLGSIVTTNGHTCHVGAVDLCLAPANHGGREARGDFTGYTLAAASAPYGLWSVIYTNGSINQVWGALTWAASTTDTNQIRVEVRAANTYARLSTSSFRMAFDSVPLTNVVGQLLEIRVTLIKPPGAPAGPWLHDLTLDCSSTFLASPTIDLLAPDSQNQYVALVHHSQADSIVSPVTATDSLNPLEFFVTDNYADAFFARQVNHYDSSSVGLNITKLPTPVISPSSGYYNYASNIVISLGSEDLTNMVQGCCRAELGRTNTVTELSNWVAYAWGLRNSGYADESIRTNLINNIFRSSSEYTNEYPSPGDVYFANNGYIIEYSTNGGLFWLTYTSPLQTSSTFQLQARVRKSSTTDNRTHYSYVASDVASGSYTNISTAWLTQYFGSGYATNSAASPSSDPDSDGLANWQEYQAGTDPLNPDTDYDGREDGQEVVDGTNPVDAGSYLGSLLAYWRFDTNSWVGEQGQVPITVSNVLNVASWNTNALKVDSNNAVLVYKAVESNGAANINCRNGSVRFWFKPDWNSSTTNSGSGPSSEARLIELGTRDTTNGWWSLVLSSNGTTFSFITQTNGAGATNLNATVQWTSNEWHQLVLTYSPNQSAVFLDGLQLGTNGTAVTLYPNIVERANGMRIGGDKDGAHQAHGIFEDLQTYNYPLDSTTVSNDYQTVLQNQDLDGNGLPDQWEIAHFGHTGVDPNGDADGDHLTNLQEYSLGTDPNNVDTDGDGRTDWQETFDNTNPLDPNSYATWPIVSDIPDTGSRQKDLNPTIGGPVLISGKYYIYISQGDPTTWYELIGEPTFAGPWAYLSQMKMGAMYLLPNTGYTSYIYAIGVAADSDFDGLSDRFELNGPTYHTSTSLPDSDFDGLSDNYEENVSHTNPNSQEAVPTLNSRTVNRCPIP